MNKAHRDILSRSAWIVFVAGAVVLAGCIGPSGSDGGQEELPPIFRFEYRYWFEGNSIVVNVSLINQANFTVGKGSTMDPLFDIGFSEAVPVEDQAEREKRQSSLEDIVVASMDVSLSCCKDRWKQRLDVRQDQDIGYVGPVTLAPNESIHLEFSYRVKNNFTGDEGYYDFGMGYLAHYPWPEVTGGPGEYHSGCFNRDVEEFYGVRKDGPDCDDWDCTGALTQHAYPIYKSGARVKSEHIPDCDASNATGPYPVPETGFDGEEPDVTPFVGIVGTLAGVLAGAWFVWRRRRR